MAETLGAFEQAVLLSIVRLRERYVAAGAVHATLARLEARGLIRSRLGMGTPIRDGRSSRLYRIEPAGVKHG
jgi:DNA-binding PadR family transcriptional regulator